MLLTTVPGFFQGASQPNAVELTFTGPVTYLSVAGMGAISCDGGYGEIVVYAGDSTELGRTALVLSNPDDCAEDNVTYGARAVLTTTLPIARAVILPMTLLSFPVYDVTGHASAEYDVAYGVTGPRILNLHADKLSISQGDTITFTATLENAAPNGANVVAWEFLPGDGAEFASMVSTPTAPSAHRVKRVTREASRPGGYPVDSVWTDPDSIDAMFAIADSVSAEYDEEPSGNAEFPATQGCQASVGMTCRIPVNSSGTMRLTVESGGQTLVHTISVSVLYACPSTVPLDLVLDPGVQVFQSTKTYIFVPNPAMWPPVLRINIGSRTVQASGPWEFVEEYPQGGGYWPLGDYRPSSASIVSSTGPAVMVRGHSTVRFGCKTWLDSSDQWRGSLQRGSKANIYWLRQ